MPRLPKFTLDYNENKGKWNLTKDSTNQIVKSFPTKDKATKGGVLEKAVGPQGGSVKIQKQNGRFQEERTYPRSGDPSKSPG
ncbi:MAG TPA: DUF2188 domain-containing protein [Pyrinomonadaceae bacterium]|nr:DUF2188 domain-containing protein [Pyrinomonadaceae bacterium]